MSDTIVIDTDFYSKSDSSLYINNVLQLTDTITLSSGLYIKKTYYRNGEHSYSILRQGSFLFRVVGDPKHQETTVRVSVSGVYGGVVKGLCGNFDGNTDSLTSPLTSGSLFTSVRPVQPPATTYTCTLPTGTLKDEADTICTNTTIIDSNLQSACYFDICATQDIGAATSVAQETYSNCVTDVTNGINRTCIAPCPNFCSFHGQCVNGQCVCNNNYNGLDCSQQISFQCFTTKWNGNTESATITPFSGPASVSTHYGLSGGSSSTGLEVADSLVMYLYQDSRDTSTVNLVYINDMKNDKSGGLQTASFTGYNPNNSKISNFCNG